MATLTLTKCWINLLPNGEAISAQSDPRRSQTHDVEGEVRTFGGGRQRSIATEGERGVFAFELVDVSLATVELLRLWKGRDVQVRDARGQRFFGTYFAVGVSESRQPTLYNVAITLRTVTVAEGV